MASRKHSDINNIDNGDIDGCLEDEDDECYHVTFQTGELNADGTQSAAPRQTGSMVAHHDDAITRMKNVELIELGQYRIKPWYFSPYPQVS